MNSFAALTFVVFNQRHYTFSVPRLEYALELMFCMPSQHHAIGLQTGCMVTVLAPVVEAARLPRVCPMALGYGLPPCNDNSTEDATQTVRPGPSDGVQCNV